MNVFAQCRGLMVGVLVLALAACSSAPNKPATAGGTGKPSGTLVQGKGKRPAHCPDGSPYQAATEDPNTRGNYRAGGLYKPGVNDSTPTYVPDVACIPEPDVVDLPRSAVGNKSPYVVLGKQYQVMDKTKGYAEKGTASYYGSKFHGRLTSNREVYDMYAFTAAHKTLPLPSFARVTNLDNGESVVVRVNDRGPFHDGRVIDLSYAAAVRLGITQRGTGNVEVRALQPGDENLLAAKPSRREQRAAQAAADAAPAPARPSDMDRLVDALPAASPATGNRPPLPRPRAWTPARSASANCHRLRRHARHRWWQQRSQPRRPAPRCPSRSAPCCCRWPASPAGRTPPARWASCPPPASSGPASATSSVVAAPCGACGFLHPTMPARRNLPAASQVWVLARRRS